MKKLKHALGIKRKKNAKQTNEIPGDNGLRSSEQFRTKPKKSQKSAASFLS